MASTDDAQIAETDARPKRVAGRCTVHDDLAWRYDDGSIGCFYCAVVETGFGGCEWEPMPEVWVQAAIYAQQNDPVLAACLSCGWNGEVILAGGSWTCPECGQALEWQDHRTAQIDGSNAPDQERPPFRSQLMTVRPNRW